jgi:aryl-alcohol dehydrogenase-like predicted oxidoreductase
MSLDYVSLGRTGTNVSELALGTWRFGRERDGSVEIDRDRAFDLLDAYADAGGTFLDTADFYGDGRAEEWLGDWLAERDRERFVVASKVFWPTRDDDPNGKGLGRKHLRRQVDLILDRLGTDYLDVLYVNRWGDYTPLKDDTPIEELLRTLDGFVDDGRVHYLGTSTIVPEAWKVARANERARQLDREPFTVAQPRYSLVNRAVEDTYLGMCRQYGLGVCPWSPLAGGFLTGKYERGEDPPEGTRAAVEPEVAGAYLSEENFETLEVVREVADAVGATPAQVSLAWLLHHDAVTAPIVGARTVAQLEENLAAADVDLSDAQFERLTDAS